MTTLDPSREAFEKHVLTENGIYVRGIGWISRNELGDYVATDTQQRWLTWQAAMAHMQAEGGGPNQAYRMLVPDVDIIRPDDEYLSDDTTTWEPVGRSIFVGMPHVRAFKPGRRKIEGST